jgi:UDP-GlcNAc3NAcA epimerase
MYDVALAHGGRANTLKAHRLEEWRLSPKGYVLATVHRAENTEDPKRLHAIADAFIQVAGKMPVLWPLHPRTRAALAGVGLLGPLGAKVEIVEPLGYLDMVAAERNAAVIATDSGGVQKEAFFHQVPCVTLRDETEWVELVEAGWNRLVAPVDATKIAGTILASIGHRGDPIRPYGDGHAARKIVDCLVAG